ncbi:hypothetical protein L228DRAFT_268558 [Xylona heveae TC161]|uniref:BTB domain-containing protein n=1 Tax=Xylona heveae (strain CBS 132557 / TC161) TaxID=1328760 RepID=A0A165GDG1_XYLHT|nr:hypothetical protein L228DRAFT_268558 [Xylona heveae TC161]KZF22059.1 hypothetical protein L228DRAFT_268558 [Xylona heveae TC161]
MFGRKTGGTSESGSFSKHPSGKVSFKARRSFRSHVGGRRAEKPPKNPPSHSSASGDSIVALNVGPERRLFAAHEEILVSSPFFASWCRGQSASLLKNTNAMAKQMDLPDEDPEIFSAVLEYLYKGDYYPRLEYNERKHTWQLENSSGNVHVEGNEENIVEPVIYHHGSEGVVSVLKETAIYCAAERFGLEGLKQLALRKQGLQYGVSCSTILTSARYAYAHTPDTDSKLRAHYIALIIRSRSTFKRSGTMQMEMDMGGKLFFDLFVAMCNHMDDLVSMR